MLLENKNYPNQAIKGPGPIVVRGSERFERSINQSAITSEHAVREVEISSSDGFTSESVLLGRAM